MSDSENQAVQSDTHTISLKLPPFAPSNPRVWFRQIEAVFNTRRITSERNRYSYVVQSLPHEVAVDVDDLLDPTPLKEPYSTLKDAIIQRTGKSASKMLRELLTTVELGDQTPSQLMRRMRSLLANRYMDDALFKEMWLDKLPIPMQQVLSTFEDSTSPEKLASHADRIHECYPVHGGHFQQPNRLPISACPLVEKVTTTSRDVHAQPVIQNANNTASTSLITPVPDLQETVRLLCEQVSNMCITIGTLQHGSRPQQRSRSKSRDQRPASWCWFHRTFGPKARRCDQPCSFHQRSNVLNGQARQ